MGLSLALLAPLTVWGCRSAPADAPASGDDGGAEASSTSQASAGTETTLSTPPACLRSGDCTEDAPHCAAPYDPGVGVIGDPVCVSTCIGAGDLARACLDDDACCSGLQCNPVDGFCSSLPGVSTTSTGGDTDTDTDGTGSSSAGSGSSSSSTSAEG